jgi:hypothetical protein
MIGAVTYSTVSFESMRRKNVKSAYKKGKADIVFEYTPEDIDESFKEKHKYILSQKRGAGLWLWKPYIINKALSEIEYGDYLMYSEAASVFIKPIPYLIKDLELSRQDIMVFDLPLISEQWTKRETFVRMQCENMGFEKRNQISSSFILLKKSDISIKFVNDYLNVCCDEKAISSVQFDPEIMNPEIFLEHREDQSILSLLSMKYNLTTFRDPSQYGKRPWEYLLSKEVVYNPVIHKNSCYPIIVLHVRKEINSLFIIKEMIKRILATSDFYPRWEIIRRNKISKEFHI